VDIIDSWINNWDELLELLGALIVALGVPIFLLVAFIAVIGLPILIRYSIDLAKKLRDPKKYWINRLGEAAGLKGVLEKTSCSEEEVHKMLLDSYTKSIAKLEQAGVSKEMICEILIESLKKNSPVHSSHALDVLARTKLMRSLNVIRRRSVEVELSALLEAIPESGSKESSATLVSISPPSEVPSL